MDPSEFPFDIEAYKRQSEIEERYIVNRFREQQNQIEEGYTPRVKRKRARSVIRDSNVHHELQADLVKHIWTKFRMFRD
ncbi:uncharacterized protein LOC130744343 [Lotus japonicus]|uniref:uncharacterized protein LOC130744343 n=1 Tax=Lotus japonicus TaxID=34305 RepID=UPI002586F313|nr:uncharacterized protein LOC130744343 [Lotus japonicus]